jgi:hypothetical protein
VPIIVLHSDEKRQHWESVNGMIKDENKPVQEWQKAHWEIGANNLK